MPEEKAASRSSFRTFLDKLRPVNGLSDLILVLELSLAGEGFMQPASEKRIAQRIFTAQIEKFYKYALRAYMTLGARACGGRVGARVRKSRLRLEREGVAIC